MAALYVHCVTGDHLHDKKDGHDVKDTLRNLQAGTLLTYHAYHAYRLIMSLFSQRDDERSILLGRDIAHRFR